MRYNYTQLCEIYTNRVRGYNFRKLENLLITGRFKFKVALIVYSLWATGFINHDSYDRIIKPVINKYYKTSNKYVRKMVKINLIYLEPSKFLEIEKSFDNKDRAIYCCYVDKSLINKVGYYRVI